MESLESLLNLSLYTGCSSHLRFRYRVCFEQGVPSYSGNYRVWSHSETRVRDMIRTYSQMHHTDKYLQGSSIIWSVWLNGWVFVYELSGCGCDSRCSHLNFRYRACFYQVVSNLWFAWDYARVLNYKGVEFSRGLDLNLSFKFPIYVTEICTCSIS